MAGFVLGTGSGILASAAVYYTLSTSLHRETAAVQHQSVRILTLLALQPHQAFQLILDRLHHSSRLLDNSFDPSTPPAPSSLVGPPRNAPVPFSTLLEQRWNHAISAATRTFRSTDFLALGSTVVATTRDLAAALGNEMKGSASDVQKGKVGRDTGALEGGLGMDRLPGRISPDVSDSERAGVHEIREIREGMSDEWEKVKDSLREGPSKQEAKVMMKEMMGDRRLV